MEVEVEVGFEPTEDLRLHTLSGTAQPHPCSATSVPHLGGQPQSVIGERLGTGVSETGTETTPADAAEPVPAVVMQSGTDPAAV